MDKPVACGMLWLTVVASVVAPTSVASGGTISLLPAAQQVRPGDTVQVDIVLSGFSTVGSFSIETRFDPSILQSTIEGMPTDAIFGPHLGIPGTETSAAWGVKEDIAIDIVITKETSQLTLTELDALQPPAFTIAHLFFDALAPGTSTLEFTLFSVGGPGQGGNLGPRLEISSVSSATITVIPEPSTLALFALGLGGVGWWRRRSKRSTQV